MHRLFMSAAMLLVAGAQASAVRAETAVTQQDIDWRRGEHCSPAQGPGFLVQIDGLKDRTGNLMVELYPATQEDFLKGDGDLLREGKVFRRVVALTPRRDPVTMCINAPAPGSYALAVIHDRDGQRKFNAWKDGIAVPANTPLGTRRPRVAVATVRTSRERQALHVQMQYLRGAQGFGPLKR